MMFLSQMLTNVRNYLTVALFLMTLFFGYMSYSSYGRIVELEAEVIALESRLKIANRDLDQQEKSCKISQAVAADVTKLNTILQNNAQADLEALNKVTHPTLPDTLQETPNDAPKAPTEAVIPYSDNDRLSPDLMRVLDSAYCSGKKDDPTCTAR